jgi:long-chain fatty acid transport protein
MIASHVPLEAVAANGTRAIAYGAASAQVAGSDVASGDDISVVVTNPANLSRIDARRFDAGGIAVIAGDRHRDGLGNDQRLDNTLIPILAAGYGQRVTGTPLTLGAGLFVHGGAGAVYKDLITPVGTRDEYSSQYGVFLLAVGASYDLSERTALGFSIVSVNGVAQQKLFPGLSVASPQSTFFGLDVDDAHVSRVGFRLGLSHRLNDAVSFGAYAANKVDLPLEGSATVNLSSVGLGRVRYASMQVDGLGTPAEVAIGMSWTARPGLELTAKIERIFWSDVYRAVSHRATRPDNPFAPAEVTLSSDLQWRDQTVVAAGAAWRATDDLTLRAGINYGTMPGRAETTSPLLSGIDRTHVTFGFSSRLYRTWEIFGGVEYLVPQDFTYTNPQQPFGPNTTLHRQYTAVHVAVSRRW